MKKRRNLYLLPSYCLRLLALPNQSRTATQKPTLVYATMTSSLPSSRMAKLTTDVAYPYGRLPLLNPWHEYESLRDISTSQESAWINAFIICCQEALFSISRQSRPALPQTGASAWRSAGAKLQTFFWFGKCFLIFLPWQSMQRDNIESCRIRLQYLGLRFYSAYTK